jgi:7-cyano-7-deazaguanine synthase in queuosine biosynthesis
MKVDITIPRTVGRGEFSKIKLGYENSKNNNISVSLNIDYVNLCKFTNQRNGLAFDVFLIGCYVYGIDILLSRKDFSTNGWSRDIEVEFPVESPELFENGKIELEHLLSFLTGDEWNISFTKRKVSSLYTFKSRAKVFTDRYRQSFNKVSLFSGGLDSLVGIIDHLSSSKDKIVLVSHYDAAFKGAKSDQDKIHKILSRKYSHYHFIQTRVDLSSSDVNGNERENEPSLRSRSFLFLCQAIFVAHSIGDGIEVLIPENGTISLNHPLTPSRRSSCSTRTAHPHYLTKVVDFISKLGLNHLIRNEYEMRTKGEMLENCNDKDTLLATYQHSCSCAKRGHKVHWDVRTAPQCGVCIPCIYRRVSLHQIGLDNENVGTDLFNPQKYQLENLPDVTAFLDYMVTPLSVEDIEKNLLVNGTLPLDKVEKYASVVDRTRNQIVDWIRDKGSVEIKKKLGIQ